MEFDETTTPKEYIRALRQWVRDCITTDSATFGIYSRDELLEHHEALGKVFDAMLAKDID